MSTAKYCKKCPKFQPGSSFCDHKKVKVSPFNDWCDWREKEYEAWRLLS